jgi:hypothetical protein
MMMMMMSVRMKPRGNQHSDMILCANRTLYKQSIQILDFRVLTVCKFMIYINMYSKYFDLSYSTLANQTLSSYLLYEFSTPVLREDVFLLHENEDLANYGYLVTYILVQYINYSFSRRFITNVTVYNFFLFLHSLLLCKS